MAVPRAWGPRGSGAQRCLFVAVDRSTPAPGVGLRTAGWGRVPHSTEVYDAGGVSSAGLALSQSKHHPVAAGARCSSAIKSRRPREPAFTHARVEANELGERARLGRESFAIGRAILMRVKNAFFLCENLQGLPVVVHLVGRPVPRLVVPVRLQDLLIFEERRCSDFGGKTADNCQRIHRQ